MAPFLVRLGAGGGTVAGFGFGKKIGLMAPIYSVSPSTSSVNEGSSVNFNVITSNVPNGTTLYWTTNTVSGTVNTSDFSDSAVSGSFTITNGAGIITRTLRSDATTEGSESFQLQIRTDSISGPIVATSSTVTVNDTSLNPTYTVSPSTTLLNEGFSVIFNVATTDVFNGTTLYWTTNTVSGTVNTSDFDDAVTSGSFTINGNSASITRTLSNDLTIEGSESFQIQIRTGSTSGPIVATSSTVTVNDTSVPTYEVSPSTTLLNEGSSVTFTITTAGVPNGTTLYWTTNTVSGTINTSDFSDSAVSGSFTISNNSGTVTRTLSNDNTTEGPESFQLQIRTTSTSGTIVATSSTVSINDSSAPAPTAGQVRVMSGINYSTFSTTPGAHNWHVSGNGLGLFLQNDYTATQPFGIRNYSVAARVNIPDRGGASGGGNQRLLSCWPNHLGNRFWFIGFDFNGSDGAGIKGWSTTDMITFTNHFTTTINRNQMTYGIGVDNVGDAYGLSGNNNTQGVGAIRYTTTGFSAVSGSALYNGGAGPVAWLGTTNRWFFRNQYNGVGRVTASNFSTFSLFYSGESGNSISNYGVDSNTGDLIFMKDDGVILAYRGSNQTTRVLTTAFGSPSVGQAQVSCWNGNFYCHNAVNNTFYTHVFGTNTTTSISLTAGTGGVLRRVMSGGWFLDVRY